jgi:hypothetical protein
MENPGFYVFSFFIWLTLGVADYFAGSGNRIDCSATIRSPMYDGTKIVV